MKERRKERLQSNDVLKQSLLLQVSRKTTKKLSKNQATNQSGITLIALVVTMVLHYDKVKKCSNSNSFLLSSI